MSAGNAKRWGEAAAEDRPMLTTAIHIRRDHWELLREVAFTRARATGGRASVSAVIGEMIEQQKGRLQRELDKEVR